MCYLGKSIPGKGMSKCKSPEVESHLVCFIRETTKKPEGWNRKNTGETGGKPGQDEPFRS